LDAESDPDYDLEVADQTYHCPGEENIISYSYLCDNFRDCGDGSDEQPEICKGKDMSLVFTSQNSKQHIIFIFRKWSVYIVEDIHFSYISFV